MKRWEYREEIWDGKSREARTGRLLAGDKHARNSKVAPYQQSAYSSGSTGGGEHQESTVLLVRKQKVLLPFCQTVFKVNLLCSYSSSAQSRATSGKSLLTLLS